MRHCGDPLPTELDDNIGKCIYERGWESGATTGPDRDANIVLRDPWGSRAATRVAASARQSSQLTYRYRGNLVLSNGIASMFIAAMITLAMTASDPALANKPVTALDLQRYSGTWHEIAHLPMFFQRQCVDNITATYTPQSNGTIEVRNACRTKDGSMDESIGVARAVDGISGQLEVRFAPSWLSWLPMVWADYWVIRLDPDYRWAVVGSPSRKYLWVLSRSPSMDTALFERLKADAGSRGYPIDKLIVAAPLE